MMTRPLGEGLPKHFTIWRLPVTEEISPQGVTGTVSFSAELYLKYIPLETTIRAPYDE